MAKMICSSSEHVPGLAQKCGYVRHWQAFWEAQTGDVKQRKNKFVLFHGDKDKKKKHKDPKPPGADVPGAAGDELDLVPPQTKTDSGPTEQVTTFKVISDKVFLRLRVLDDQFHELKDAKWHLKIEGLHYPRINGKPGGPNDWAPFEKGGLINVEIAGSLNVHTGRLSVKLPPPPGTQPDPSTSSKPATPSPIILNFYLSVGRLDPIQEQAPDEKCISGVQQRLNNLGFSSGQVDGVEGPSLRGAIKRFQQRCKLDPADGQPSQAVQDKLHEIHDRPGLPPEPEQKKKGKSTGDSAPSTSDSGDTEVELGTGLSSEEGFLHPTGEEVYAVATKDVPKDCPPGYYWDPKDLKAHGAPEDMLHKGKVVLGKGTKGTYCCAYSCWVVLKTAAKYKLLADTADKTYTVADLISFQQNCFNAGPGSAEKGIAMAVPKLGIGSEIKFQDAQRGDLCQIWRTPRFRDATFVEWARQRGGKEDGKVIGLKYETSSKATITEYFTTAALKPATVDKDTTYKSTLKKGDPIRVYYIPKASGHSVVFAEWLGPANNPTGMKYVSSQGSTKGIGTNSEHFSKVDGDGCIDRKRTYFARLTPIETAPQS